MKYLYSVAFLVFISAAALAQRNGVVQGVAFDTISRQPVNGATVTVLNSKDSSLIGFTMTGNDGKFEVRNLANGDYRLLITHVNYHNSNTYFSLSENKKTATLGNVVMNDKTKVLQEVVVASEAPPITLINDTIQYNAGSFKTAPNASVEQLLKKMPGIEVAKDGTIKAQGEKVTKVLVDGKEFFSNDPKVATKNLPADAIDKVQVYDKQSDQAQLTGFEDGNYEKTINLKLKQDKKKGMFGKINAGAGTDNRYEGKFNVNSFKGARQFSAIGMGNNTNAEGFSFMDILNFTGELSRMQRGSGGGDININISDADAAAMGINAGGRNSGINTAWGGGLNYNNIIGKNVDLQSNYFYNRYNPQQESHIQRQYFLPDSSYYYNQDANSNNLNNSHRFNANALFQVDSFNSIRVTSSYNTQQTDNRSQTNYQTLSGNKLLTNEGFSNTTSGTNGYNLRNDVIWRKKFARRGRTFSLSMQTSINESNGDGTLNSINSFYNPGGSLFLRDTINQKNNTSSMLNSYYGRAVYTEPIFKRSLVEFSAGKSYSKSTAGKTTYDYNPLNAKFDQYNSSLSNNFENTYGFTNTGIRMRTQKKNYSYMLGMSWQQADLEGKVITGTKDSTLSKTFYNLLPSARFQYRFSKFKTAAVTYSTSTNQPNISQLQPVPDNSNPLNIKDGNPNLKQEYNHFVQANMNLMSPYKNKNLFFFLTMQATQNKIVNYDSINNLGIKRTKPVNVNGVYNINSNFSYSMPVHFLKGMIEFSSNTGLFKTKQFINGVGNDIKTFSAGPGIRVNSNATEKFSIETGASFNYNKTNYSLQSSLNASYFSQEYNLSADWELPAKFFLSSDFTYTINSQRAAGFNTKVPLWNASISKQVLKYNRGELKLGARDLLNQNIGISRNTNNNYIEDARVLTLKRFFVLSFTYSLNKTGLNNAGKDGGMRIIRK
ncbi:MAG: outer membrane beta-barrel protein [Bacteroidetes bacterium]|nr:outer membrane beta-barrel protein [Bacteroidota bacterium]